MLNNIKNEKYFCLKIPFKKWFLDKYQEAESNDLKIDPALLESLKMNNDEFFDTFIKPYGLLDLEIIKQILAHQEKFFRDCKVPQPAPFSLDLKIQENTMINALMWLLVNITDLNILEFDDEILEHYWHPYKQCHYCGKPNHYFHKSGKMPFNNKTKFCHSHSCKNRAESNPQYHPKCCYGIWTLKKKALMQRINLSNDKNSKSDYLIDFCEEQLNHNLNIQWTIQTGKEEGRAYHLSEFWSKENACSQEAELNEIIDVD